MDEKHEKHEKKWTRKGNLEHQRLLESACYLFESKGYEKTTMREIVAEAGYSPSSPIGTSEAKKNWYLDSIRTCVWN